MKKSLQHLVFGGLCAAILVTGNAVNAQISTKAKTAEVKATDTAKETTKSTKPKQDWYGFGLVVESVDKSAKTVTIKKKEGERILHTDAQTTFEMDGKPATLASVKSGYYLHGKLHKENSVEYILDAKIELETPAKKGTNTVAKAVSPVVAAPAMEDASTNGVVKKAKKKKAPTATGSN